MIKATDLFTHQNNSFNHLCLRERNKIREISAACLAPDGSLNVKHIQELLGELNNKSNKNALEKHLIIILKQLIDKPELEQCLINLDITKLSNVGKHLVSASLGKSKQTLTINDIRLVVLQALLTHLRQQEPFGDCFAIQPLIFLSDNNPLKLANALCEILQKGFLSLNEAPHFGNFLFHSPLMSAHFKLNSSLEWVEYEDSKITLKFFVEQFLTLPLQSTFPQLTKNTDEIIELIQKIAERQEWFTINDILEEIFSNQKNHVDKAKLYIHALNIEPALLYLESCMASFNRPHSDYLKPLHRAIEQAFNFMLKEYASQFDSRTLFLVRKTLKEVIFDIQNIRYIYSLQTPRPNTESCAWILSLKDEDTPSQWKPVLSPDEFINFLKQALQKTFNKLKCNSIVHLESTFSKLLQPAELEKFALRIFNNFKLSHQYPSNKLSNLNEWKDFPIVPWCLEIGGQNDEVLRQFLQFPDTGFESIKKGHSDLLEFFKLSHAIRNKQTLPNAPVKWPISSEGHTFSFFAHPTAKPKETATNALTGMKESLDSITTKPLTTKQCEDLYTSIKDYLRTEHGFKHHEVQQFIMQLKKLDLTSKPMKNAWNQIIEQIQAVDLAINQQQTIHPTNIDILFLRLFFQPYIDTHAITLFDSNFRAKPPINNLHDEHIAYVLNPRTNKPMYIVLDENKHYVQREHFADHWQSPKPTQLALKKVFG